MTANTFESRIGGVTVTGRAHSLSTWFVLALRLMMGIAFLNGGLSKLLGPEPFDAQGYLLHGIAEVIPLVRVGRPSVHGDREPVVLRGEGDVDDLEGDGVACRVVAVRADLREFGQEGGVGQAVELPVGRR